MPSSQSVRHPPSDAPPARPRSVLRIAAAAAVVGLVGLASAGPLLAGPTHLPAFRIANPTGYDVDVTVRSGPGKAQLFVATAARGRTTTVEELLDPGDVWVLSFVAQGRDGGSVTLARSDLKAAGWTFTVPAGVETALRTAGAPEQP